MDENKRRRKREFAAGFLGGLTVFGALALCFGGFLFL